MPLTLKDYKEALAAGVNRYSVYCENDTGIVFFVRDKQELHENCFTTDVFEALQLCYDNAELLRDSMELLHSDAGIEFKILMVHCDYIWDYNVS